MIEQGLVHEYTYRVPYKYQTEFKAAQKVAQDAQTGLWSPSSCSGDTTKEAAVSTLIVETSKPTQVSGHVYYLSTFRTATDYYYDTDDE